MAHPEDERQELGANLAIARTAAGLTLDAAASDLTAHGYQIHRATIGAWEKGRNLPDALWLRRLAKLYEISVDALLGTQAALAWPFQRVPLERVLALEPDELAYVEGQLQAALNGLDAPPPKPQTVRLTGARPNSRKKSA